MINPPNPVEEVNRKLIALSKCGVPGNYRWCSLNKVMFLVADQLRVEVNELKPPINLQKIVKLRSIAIKQNCNQKTLGMLVPVTNGFTMLLAVQQSMERMRFTIAHEIGHSFFYDLSKNPPARFFPSYIGGLTHYKEEQICHSFASELLMPRDLIKATLQKVSFSNPCNQIEEFARMFLVSFEVASIRLLKELAILPNCLVLIGKSRIIYGTRARPNQQSPRKKEAIATVLAKWPGFIDKGFTEEIKKDYASFFDIYLPEENGRNDCCLLSLKKLKPSKPLPRIADSH